MPVLRHRCVANVKYGRPSWVLCGIVHVGNDFLKGGYVNIPNYQSETGTQNLNGITVFVLVSNCLELGRDMATCESNIFLHANCFVSPACLLFFASSLQVCPYYSTEGSTLITIGIQKLNIKLYLIKFYVCMFTLCLPISYVFHPYFIFQLFYRVFFRLQKK